MQNELHTYTWTVNGDRANVSDVLKLDIDYGRFFTEEDDQQRAHVAVIGSEAKTKLFAGAISDWAAYPAQWHQL